MHATHNEAVPTTATPEPVTDSTVTPARVLRDAATYLARYGWVQGAYFDQSYRTFTPPACTVGAIGMVCYGGPVEAPSQHFNDPGWVDFEDAVTYLDRFLCEYNPYDTDAYSYNDTPGRTRDQVVNTLCAAADIYDERAGITVPSTPIVAPACCDRPMAEHPISPSIRYGNPDALRVARVFQCAACRRWQDVEVTDPAEYDRIVDAVLGGGDEQ